MPSRIFLLLPDATSKSLKPGSLLEREFGIGKLGPGVGAGRLLKNGICRASEHLLLLFGSKDSIFDIMSIKSGPENKEILHIVLEMASQIIY